jgi:hypothetical protein
MTPAEIVRDFYNGKHLFTANGQRIVEIVEYSCAPKRIDGLEDEETVAIRVEGEPEQSGLTPCSHTGITVAP